MNLITVDLDALGTVALRKLAREMGIKGQSSARGADLRALLAPMKAEQVFQTEREAELAAIEAESKPLVAASRTEVKIPTAKPKCDVCGVRNRSTKAQRDRMGLGSSYSDMCIPCYEEAGWENTHSDAGHDAIQAKPESERTAEELAEIDGCWICFPELNDAKKEHAPREGRSRAGMVIVAKGTEIHKSTTFKVAAEAAGWTVTLQSETYELPEGTTGEGTRYYATAVKGTESISLAWDGRAYDYPASSAVIAGKGRKVRNLKEALRLV
jgi:hypothetical protein